MPGHDGLWLLGQVAGSDLDVCIVMVTGDTDVHTAVSCLTRGADDYITKPVDKAQLTQTVAKAVQTRRLRIETRPTAKIWSAWWASEPPNWKVPCRTCARAARLLRTSCRAPSSLSLIHI